ncbi:hypothetical protein [Brevundimonas sp.]|uniref:hypothetical protein n=1 Tax=Brevundimonas sp. TaxID=1871086 RepID=UPI00289B9F75|nr:hypothetical protein [Brevundimonas sp.]
MRRPLWIDLKTKQVSQQVHLLLQDLLAGLDAATGFIVGLQADGPLGRLIGPFVFAPGEAVVTFESDADFMFGRHASRLRFVGWERT